MVAPGVKVVPGTVMVAGAKVVTATATPVVMEISSANVLVAASAFVTDEVNEADAMDGGRVIVYEACTDRFWPDAPRPRRRSPRTERLTLTRAGDMSKALAMPLATDCTLLAFPTKATGSGTLSPNVPVTKVAVVASADVSVSAVPVVDESTNLELDVRGAPVVVDDVFMLDAVCGLAAGIVEDDAITAAEDEDAAALVPLAGSPVATVDGPVDAVVPCAVTLPADNPAAELNVP